MPSYMHTVAIEHLAEVEKDMFSSSIQGPWVTLYRRLLHAGYTYVEKDVANAAAVAQWLHHIHGGMLLFRVLHAVRT